MSLPPFSLVVMGASAGGAAVLTAILQTLRSPYPIPILAVQHRSPNSRNFFETIKVSSGIKIKEPEDKETAEADHFYLAPADYHLLVNPDGTMSFSVEEKVLFCRPSIDLLFESAARFFGKRTIGVILTGANGDGAMGLGMIRAAGGVTIVQNPSSAYCREMPEAAIKTGGADYILEPGEIAEKLNQLAGA